MLSAERSVLFISCIFAQHPTLFSLRYSILSHDRILFDESVCILRFKFNNRPFCENPTGLLNVRWWCCPPVISLCSSLLRSACICLRIKYAIFAFIYLDVVCIYGRTWTEASPSSVVQSTRSQRRIFPFTCQRIHLNTRQPCVCVREREQFSMW